jgi:hypothetical protein
VAFPLASQESTRTWHPIRKSKVAAQQPAMNPTTAAGAGAHHHHREFRGSGPHHRPGPHHLSSKALSIEHEGWAEGIVSLREDHTATALLEDSPRAAAPAGAQVRCC